MKKFLFTMLMLVMVLCMTGCNYEETITVDAKGNMKIEMVQYLSAEEISMFAAFASEGQQTVLSEQEIYEIFGQQIVDVKMVNGVKNYGIGDENTNQAISAEMINASADEFVISENEFVYTVVDELAAMTNSNDYVNAENAGFSEELVEEILANTTFTFIVNLPKEIILTNGKLSNGGKTVEFTVDASTELGTRFYAYTADSDRFALLTGVNGEYTNKSKVGIWSPESLKSVKVNGVKKNGKQLSLAKDGTYNIEVVTAHGTSNMKVVKDTAKPVVKGIKSGSTYKKGVAIKCSDKSSGIAAIALDGVSVKNGTKVKKTGKHTLIVMDKAGNKTTVNFKVKK